MAACHFQRDLIPEFEFLGGEEPVLGTPRPGLQFCSLTDQLCDFGQVMSLDFGSFNCKIGIITTNSWCYCDDLTGMEQLRNVQSMAVGSLGAL